MAKSYYPPTALTDALEVAKVIAEKNNGHATPKLTLAELLEIKSEGRRYRDLVTASSGYGLTKGSYAAAEVELLPAYKALLEKDIDAVIATLMENECFKRLHERYLNAGIPPLSAAKSFLEKECGVPTGQSEGVFEGVLRNARAWQLIQDKAGSEKFVPVEMAKASSSTSPVTAASSVPATTQNPRKKAEPAGVKEKPTPKGKLEDTNVNDPRAFKPEIHIDVQIHIGPETTPEQIEKIFSSMSKHLYPTKAG